MCKVTDCEKPTHSLGYCQAHYRLFRKYGKPETLSPERRQAPGPKPKQKPAKVDRKPVTECPQGHLYDDGNTYVDKSGYKHCKTCRKSRMQQRRGNLISEVRAGNVEPTKYTSNGLGSGYHNTQKTHCPKGHDYTPENTSYSKKGSRHCRACARANQSLQTIKKYGITLEQFHEHLESQGNCCAICARDLSDLIVCVDHDHACCPGQRACGDCVRGLLCHACNRGIGSFEDSVDRLASAQRYLASRL